MAQDRNYRSIKRYFWGETVLFDYHQNLNNAEAENPSHNINGEDFLWLQLRKKQLSNVEFYRKKAIGNYHVDFYSPSARLVIEVDGSPFASDENFNTAQRDTYLSTLGLSVLRFSSHEILEEIEAVLDIIAQTLKLRLKAARQA